MEGKERNEHILALKVMRLTRPTLSSPLIVTSDAKDLPGNLFNNDLKHDITSVSGVETLAAGQFLLLPQSFGNIYLGETFSSYICVHNDSSQIASDVSVKVDLQTNSQRIPLSGGHSEAVAKELHPQETVDDVIHHEVKEVGTHILLCEVSYNSPTRNHLSFRKFFKFEVFKPLDVKTKFYNAESDEVYLEAQVQNITSGPICLEKVSLESSHLFNATTVWIWRLLYSRLSSSSGLTAAITSLLALLTTRISSPSPSPFNQYDEAIEDWDNYEIQLRQLFLAFGIADEHKLTALNSTPAGESVFGRVNVLQPQASRQFLYCLAPQPSLTSDLRLLAGATNIGKLDIVWRSNLGERGRLQTSQLQRMAPDYGDIRLSVQELPNIVILEETFTIVCRIINTCERSMDLVLGLESSAASGLVWSGVSGRQMGKLEPGASVYFSLCLVPTTPGLQNISGIRLTDVFLKRTYDYDELAQVFVTQKSE